MKGTHPALEDEAATCRDLAKCLRQLQSASAAGERREALTEGMAQLKAALCGEPRPASIRQPAAAGSKRQRSDAGGERGPQLLPTLHNSALGDRLIAMGAKRQLTRDCVVGGEELSRVEWLLQRDDNWELRRVYAMAHFVTLRREGISVVDAVAQAAGGVVLNAEGKTLTSRWLATWLCDFVRADGRIAPSRRGAHRKTECFLDLPNVKERAREWLRQHCQAARIPATRGEPGGGSAAGSAAAAAWPFEERPAIGVGGGSGLNMSGAGVQFG